MPAEAPPLRTWRLAVSFVFLAQGCLAASWVVRLPTLKAQLGLGEEQLGVALFFRSAGALVALPVAAWLMARVGSGRVSAGACVLALSALVLVAAAPSGLTFGAALALYGMGMASTDVAMNAQSVEVEKRYGRSILASFHGGWCLGGLLGAGLGSLVTRWEVAPLPHYVGLCAVLLVALGLAAPRLLPASPEPSRGPVLALPDRTALGPGAMAFCGSLFEGGIAAWSGIYLKESLGTSASTAALGFALYLLAMLGGRLVGDRVVERLGRVRTVRWGTGLATLALVAVLLAGRPAVALAGLPLVGLGVATAFPLIFGAAGRLRMGSGTVLPAVVTLAYVGGMVGPALMGPLAQRAGLPVAMGVLVVACGTLFALGHHVQRPEDRAAQGPVPLAETP